MLFWCLLLEGQFGLTLVSSFRFGFGLIVLIDFVIIVIKCLLDVLVAPFEELVDLGVWDCIVLSDSPEKTDGLLVH